MPYKKYEVGKKSDWTRTHAKFKNLYGASFCRDVDMDLADEKWTPSGKHATLPTCQRCLKSMIVHLACDVSDANEND